MKTLGHRGNFLALLFFAAMTLSACGGGGDSSGASTGSYMTINGNTYSPNSAATVVSVNQTSLLNYSLGGPAFTVAMSDSASGTLVNISTVTTASGLPSVNSLSTSSGTTAIFMEKSGGSTVTYGDFANPTTTNGNATVKTFGEIGQQVTGSFDLNLCLQATCSASVKNFKGEFSANRLPNNGSSLSPIIISPMITNSQYKATHGIAPQTGANYYQVTTATAGTATITLSPTTDVDLAVYSDAAFSTPATCDITSTLAVVGSGTETCAITTAANQKLYLKASQKQSVTSRDTYTLTITK